MPRGHAGALPMYAGGDVARGKQGCTTPTGRRWSGPRRGAVAGCGRAGRDAMLGRTCTNDGRLIDGVA